MDDTIALSSKTVSLLLNNRRPRRRCEQHAYDYKLPGIYFLLDQLWVPKLSGTNM